MAVPPGYLAQDGPQPSYGYKARTPLRHCDATIRSSVAGRRSVEPGCPFSRAIRRMRIWPDTVHSASSCSLALALVAIV